MDVEDQEADDLGYQPPKELGRKLGACLLKIMIHYLFWRV
jgi:hypothetical protein